MGVAHDRLRSVWRGAWGTSHHECTAARDRGAAALSSLVPNDRNNVAQRHRGCVICVAPTASGYRRVGHRAKEYFSRAVLGADDARVSALRGALNSGSLRAGVDLLCAWPYFETGAGNVTGCVVVV